MYGAETMPKTAENVAQRLQNHARSTRSICFRKPQRAKKAMEENRFADEIVPVIVKDRKGNEIIVDQDEHPRPEYIHLKNLDKLRPIFEGGTVTAGNASGVNDGASALLIMSAEKAKELNLKPLAKYVAGATAGLNRLSWVLVQFMLPEKH